MSSWVHSPTVWFLIPYLLVFSSYKKQEARLKFTTIYTPTKEKRENKNVYGGGGERVNGNGKRQRERYTVNTITHRPLWHASYFLVSWSPRHSLSSPFQFLFLIIISPVYTTCSLSLVISLFIFNNFTLAIKMTLVELVTKLSLMSPRDEKMSWVINKPLTVL